MLYHSSYVTIPLVPPFQHSLQQTKEEEMRQLSHAHEHHMTTLFYSSLHSAGRTSLPVPSVVALLLSRGRLEVLTMPSSQGITKTLSVLLLRLPEVVRQFGPITQIQ